PLTNAIAVGDAPASGEGEAPAEPGGTPIPTQFTLQDNVASLQLAPYDPTQTLVIDPLVDYGAYFGGAGTELGNAVAVDGAGNAYITGTTITTGFPSHQDAFVAKFSAKGDLMYSTYLGGSGQTVFGSLNDFDKGNGIAVDLAGAAYVVGGTNSTDFPTTSGAYDTSWTGSSGFTPHALVPKPDASGDSLPHPTCLSTQAAPH